jgi:hypothetical protein
VKSVQILGFVVVVASVAGACSPVSSGIEGVTCSSDSDCMNGLQCLTYVLPEGGADGGCSTEFGLECLRPCKSNSDCSSDTAGFVGCIAACGGLGVCEPGVGYTPADAGTDADATAAPEASVSSDATAAEASVAPDATVTTDAAGD